MAQIKATCDKNEERAVRIHSVRVHDICGKRIEVQRLYKDSHGATSLKFQFYHFLVQSFFGWEAITACGVEIRRLLTLKDKCLASRTHSFL